MSDWERKPPIVIKDRMYRFTCVTCGQPGESLSHITCTHEGACREARQRKIQARGTAAQTARRAAARRRADKG